MKYKLHDLVTAFSTTGSYIAIGRVSGTFRCGDKNFYRVNGSDFLESHLKPGSLVVEDQSSFEFTRNYRAV